MRTKRNEAFDTARNWGFIAPAMQAKLATSRVAIAGVGGVGGRIAVELTRLGIGSLVLADPDTFSASNSNRQEGSASSTLGKNKAHVIAGICRDINPDITVDLYLEGVAAENVADFLAGADLLVEATDYTAPHLGLMLAREARTLGIPMLTGAEIGFGATVVWFSPTGYPYEQYLGLDKNVLLADLKAGKVSVDISRWIPHIPSYGDLDVLRQVAAGTKEAPAISPAVGLCSAMAVTQIVNILGGQPAMPPAPAIFSVDVRELRSRIIRHPGWHHRISLLRALVGSLLSHK